MLEDVISEGDYATCVTVRAPRERVFDAVATVDGLRGWWTSDVTGSPSPGDELRFGFDEVDEWIAMRVDRAERPGVVEWTCVGQRHGPEHDAEWVGTRVIFTLVGRGPDECELSLRHAGLTPELVCYDQCANGWDHFIESLAAYAERGEGSPFGS
jgi:uncharacterized protein YndB with AHSA1/START domain